MRKVEMGLKMFVYTVSDKMSHHCYGPKFSLGRGGGLLGKEF